MILVVESNSSDQFALFPSESGGGIIISQHEILNLSQSYSKLYDLYVSRLSELLVEQYKLKDSVISLLLRSALVPLIHCFLDRLIRVKKAIEVMPKGLTIPRQILFPALDTIEEFQKCAIDNPVFNQSMINLVSRVWQLPESEATIEPVHYKAQLGFKNHLFSLYNKTPYFLIKKGFLRFLSWLPLNRYPALTMANATEPLSKYGFYFRFIKNINLNWQLNVKSKEISNRKRIFSIEFVDSNELNDLFDLINLSQVEKNNAISLLSEFLQLYYPSSLLESMPNNIKQALLLLKKFKKNKTLITSGRGTREEYMVAAAKQEDFVIVDHQHGGHYGYLEDVSVIVELEYSGVDNFLSWGWTKLPKQHLFENMSVTPLPSPWLSERKKYWSKHNLSGSKEFDILLMPNMVKRFTGAPQGASSSRIDLIGEMSKFLITIIQKTSENSISVLHKPYNTTTIALLKKTLQQISEIGKEFYSCEKQLDKGLNFKLIKRCHVVIWDQPGTGFLECLVSNIPTMIYWPRTYCQEEEWVKSDFNRLEQVGIIHRDIMTLISEILNFKKSPESWILNQERVSVIKTFCHKFAWASEDWPKQWKKYFRTLN